MYVDAYHDRKKQIVLVSTRKPQTGERETLEFPQVFRAYATDPRGTFRSMFNDPVVKIETTNSAHFKKMMWKYADSKIFESDINPVFVTLEDHFKDVESPSLKIGLFDIETDFNPERNADSDAWNPTDKVTAISLHHGGIDKLITLALKPDELDYETAEHAVSQFPDTYLFDDEAEMLDTFLNLIDDLDVLSGWNSSLYDIPYLVNRVARVLGKKHIKRFCLWGVQPNKRGFMRYGKEMHTYDLHGRIHMDYLELYAKHNPQQLLSYRLDFVGGIEVGEHKVPYTGTLDNLYRNEFQKFIEYNRQDVDILVKIDKKRRYIDLANQTAHATCVPLTTTMGSVSLIEQAITLRAHDMNVVVPNRKRTRGDNEDFEEQFPDIGEYELDDDADYEYVPTAIGEMQTSHAAVGAYVANPKVGIHFYVGAVDLNSLYPSAIRSINMSPETLVGQIRLDLTHAELSRRVSVEKVKRADAWEGMFATLEFSHVQNKTEQMLTVDFEDGTTKVMPARELHGIIYSPKSHYTLSANGTIFDRRKEGVIPSLLRLWYQQRKEMQAKEHHFGSLAHGVDIKDTNLQDILTEGLAGLPEVETSEYDHAALVKAVERNDIEAIVTIAVTHGLHMNGEVLEPFATSKAMWRDLADFWNRRQQARKILLNSLYGALLNEACKFYDHRLGQSTTLTGRSIAKHMNGRVNFEVTGIEDYKGAAVIYSDTDSSYFSAHHLLDTEYFKQKYPHFVPSNDSYVKLYDEIAANVNATFTPFMCATFNTSTEGGSVIKAGREIVAKSAIFIKKKKYACLVYDKEGERYDVNGKPGKIKAMGLDLKRADTPKIMQEFLGDMLMDILVGKQKDEIFESIINFRRKFKALPSWEKGTPRKVNGLTAYRAKISDNVVNTIHDVTVKGKKTTIPSHVAASLQWNTLIARENDKYSSKITDGSKIVVCKLRPNPYKMKAVAYPIDQTSLPEWFKNLPFDDNAMEDVIIDKKINNVTSALGWSLVESRDDNLANDFMTW